jgi:glucose-1-phosphate cytidylyltransferase
MKVVILAGGLGTRLMEETEARPKPMVEIGGKPILWHIMKNLSQQDLNKFIICLGYKGDQIKDFFINYKTRVNDITVNLDGSGVSKHHTFSKEEKWEVTLANTGLSTMTGGRIYKIRDYVNKERFLCTYGDGLADIDLKSLIEFHKKHGKIATVTAVRPTTRFGALKIDDNNIVKNFSEKFDFNGYWKELSDRVFDRFNEVKDDYDFINFVAKNGRKWYLENGTTDSNVNIIYNLLDFNKLK